MKYIAQILTFLFCFFISLDELVAQSEDKYDERFQGIDTASIKTGYLLNQGFPFIYEIAGFDFTANEGGTKQITTDALHWRQLYLGLGRSVLSKQPQLNPLNQIWHYSTNNYKTNTFIPIGILNFEGNLLTNEEITENIETKAQGKKNDKPYKTLRILAASVLQENIYSGKVTFQIDPDLYFSNTKDEVVRLSIDFDDDNGYRDFGLKSSSISVRYPIVGEKNIRIKLFTKRDTLISYTKVNIHTLERVEPDIKGEVTTFNPDTGSENSRTMGSVAGGTYEIYNGCDGILNKPVIVVEPFDPLSTKNEADIFDDYERAGLFGTGGELYSYGYDLVVLNFNNGSDFIQNNAQVLKALITEINDPMMKVGNFENIVIGQSMGGLVSRYALKELENDNIDHKVGLFINHDGGQRGSNLMPGAQFMLSSLKNSFYTQLASSTFVSIRYLYHYFSGQWEDITFGDPLHLAWTALNSPAAQQLLVRQYPPNQSTYHNFQSELSTFGYPEDLRKVVLANGSSRRVHLYIGTKIKIGEPGPPLIEIDGLGITGEDTFLKIWWSPSDFQNAPVSKLHFRSLPQSVIFEGTYNFDSEHYDFAPAGTFEIPDMPSFIETFDNDVFSHLPIVSAVDLVSPYGEDLSYVHNKYVSWKHTFRNLINDNKTPFDGIYAPIKNTHHVDLEHEEIQEILDLILAREIMVDTMYLQNRTITHDRDFETDRLLAAGNDVHHPVWVDPNDLVSKVIETGDVVIETGNTVNFTAGNEIRLLPGFEAKAGATFTAKTENNIGCSSSSRAARTTNFFPTPMIQGPRYLDAVDTFTIYNKRSEPFMRYSWTLRGENVKMQASDTIFVPPSDLQPGQYTLTCTGDNGEMEKAKSRTFIVPSPLGLLAENSATEESKAFLENILAKKSTSTIQLSPNPTSDKLKITYQVNTQSRVNIYLTDMNGTIVQHISEQPNHPVGSFEVNADIAELSSGIYFCVVETSYSKQTERLIIIK